MADKSKLDSKLGTGTWDAWAKLQKQHLEAAKATESWDRWFTFGYTADMVTACREDIILLDMIGDLYRDAIENACAGRAGVTAFSLQRLRNAYQEAINLVNGDTLLISTIQESGLSRTLVAFDVAVLKLRTESAIVKVMAASTAVKVAMTNERTAMEKISLDIASQVLALALPELTITAKIVIGVSKWTVGKFLVGKKQEVEGDIEQANGTLRTIKTLRDYKAGLANKGFQVLLDSSEVLASDLTYLNAAKALRAAQGELEKLVAAVSARADTLYMLSSNVRSIQIRCKFVRSDLLDTLDAALRDAGYSLEYFVND